MLDLRQNLLSLHSGRVSASDHPDVCILGPGGEWNLLDLADKMLFSRLPEYLFQIHHIPIISISIPGILDEIGSHAVHEQDHSLGRFLPI